MRYSLRQETAKELVSTAGLVSEACSVYTGNDLNVCIGCVEESEALRVCGPTQSLC